MKPNVDELLYTPLIQSQPKALINFSHGEVAYWISPSTQKHALEETYKTIMSAIDGDFTAVINTCFAMAVLGSEKIVAGPVLEQEKENSPTPEELEEVRVACDFFFKVLISTNPVADQVYNGYQLLASPISDRLVFEKLTSPLFDFAGQS